MAKTEKDVQSQCHEFRQMFESLRREVAAVIVGHDDIVENVLVCLFCGGHVLLEGVPGLGKTLLVRTLSSALSLQFRRIQFTPDLMPADIIGTNIVMEDATTGRRQFEFQPGPIFGQIILADEINRATPKTQSAMLEAMQEHSVTSGGQLRRLPEPFMVLATQNPIEQEGTYPLPEAQLDRFFFKLLVPYSNRDELGSIIDRTTAGENPQAKAVINDEQILWAQGLARQVAIAPHVQDYAIRLVDRDDQSVCPVRLLAARCSGARSCSEGKGHARRALPREFQRHLWRRPAGPASPHPAQLRGSGRGNNKR
jgi:MoxR-like ATPase